MVVKCDRFDCKHNEDGRCTKDVVYIRADGKCADYDPEIKIYKVTMRYKNSPTIVAEVYIGAYTRGEAVESAKSKIGEGWEVVHVVRW